MYTHAPNGFADRHKQTACTLFHGRYFIDTDEMRFLRGTFSITVHRIKFLCTLHKNQSHAHNSVAFFVLFLSAPPHDTQALVIHRKKEEAKRTAGH
jgi:hypothetical protein